MALVNSVKIQLGAALLKSFSALRFAVRRAPQRSARNCPKNGSLSSSGVIWVSVDLANARNRIAVGRRPTFWWALVMGAEVAD